MTDDPEHISEYPIVGEDKASANEDVFVYGPPGTGKTTQLKRRLHGVFRDTEYNLSDYTFVTYRRSQARETMHELQYEGWLPEDAHYRPSRGSTRYVGTLHGICRRLIEESFSASRYSDVFGASNPNVASKEDRRQWCEERSIAYDPAGVTKTEGELLFSVWEWSRQNWPVYLSKDVDASRFDQLSEGDQRRVMMRCPEWDALRRQSWDGMPVELYYEYRDWLYDNGLQDFTDMLETVIAHSLNPPTRGVVIDEAHDLNAVMLSVIMMWARDADHVMIAGDKNQVINKYQGARRDLYTSIPDYLNLPEVLLDESHRLHPRIWTAARSMLQNAHDPPSVEPVNTEANGCIDVRESPTFTPDWVGQTWTNTNTPSPNTENSPANLYRRFVRDGPYSDVLMLARTRRQVRGLKHVLDRGGIPHVTQSGLRGWLSALEPSVNEASRLSIYNLITQLSQVDPETVTDRQLIQQSRGKRVSDVSLASDEVEAFVEYCPMDLVEEGSREQLREYTELATPSLDAAKLPLSHEGWMTFTDSRTTGLNALTRWYQSEREKQAVQRALTEYDRTLSSHVPRRVKIMTIHASKGDEADLAVVYDGVTSKIREAIKDDPEARRNEYRTWYVAFSRAREHLAVMRGAWDMQTTSLIPENFDQRIATETARAYQQHV